MKTFHPIAGGALAALVLAGPALADPGETHGYGHMYGDGSWQGWFMGPMMMILFLAIVVVVAVLLVRWLGGSGPGGHGATHHLSPGRAPLDILRERFARGEIDKDEFEERRRILGD